LPEAVPGGLVNVRIASALALAAVLAMGCRSTPEDQIAFEEVAPADELYAEGLEVLEGRSILGVYTYVNYSKAIEAFQSIIDNYPYSEYAVEAELQIADAYFADAKYEEALSYYRDFGELHPQHERVSYTVFRSALCHERRVGATNRDQTATRQAVAALDRLITGYPTSEYAKEGEALWRDLQIRLAENVEGIADFYRSRQEYEAAAERYRSLLNEYPGFGLDARVLFKLGGCYESLNRIDEADRIFRTIVAHYGETRWAFEARSRIASDLQ
jgi:outer membrane protein assembly factor BamD